MKKIILATVLTLLINCETKPTKWEYKTVVLTGKTQEQRGGGLGSVNYYYLFAFNDLTETRVDFGVYVNYKVGDSVELRKNEGDPFERWYINKKEEQ